VTSLQARITEKAFGPPLERWPHFLPGTTDRRSGDRHPEVDVGAWALRIRGSVADELSLSLQDLQSLDTHTMTDAFACLEGWTAEDLAWRGVRTGDLLDMAVPIPGRTHALVRSIDGEYACSFELGRLRDGLVAPPTRG
jgi:DMSO/TMAO reductase YedYZ molybdopterin-dependent catalytic subunit